MALSFPTTFNPTLFGSQKPWNLSRSQEISRNRRGQTFVKDLGSPLWTCELRTRPLRNDAALAVEAKVNSLDGGINTFYFGDLRRLTPAAHISGYDDSAAAILAINGNNKAISVDGLPAGVTLTAGDYISFDYGPSDARAYHQIMETVTADGSGVTPEFEVRPHLRAGVAVNDSVSLLNPLAEMMIIPDTYDPQEAGPLHTVLSWKCIQVIAV